MDIATLSPTFHYRSLFWRLVLIKSMNYRIAEVEPMQAQHMEACWWHSTKENYRWYTIVSEAQGDIIVLDFAELKGSRGLLFVDLAQSGWRA